MGYRGNRKPEVMIRIATTEDEELILRHILKFVATTPYKDYVDEEALKNVINIFLNSPDKIILCHGEVGMLVGMAVPMIIGKGFIATELAWWVEPEARKNGIGLELIQAFEFWSKKIGCSLVSMSALDDQLGKFYEKNGYALQERAYVKVL